MHEQILYTKLEHLAGFVKRRSLQVAPSGRRHAAAAYI